MTKKEKRTAEDKDREKWMARFQVRLALQPGVDREIVLRAVKDVTGHCAITGEHPRDAFGDPDEHAVRVAALLVPADRAERERKRDAVVDAIGNAFKRAGDAAGL
ncbi:MULTISPECIES: hypothetical protein [Streptomyces]|uniref:Uncharacterized protein n=1 Tax=Streptomyces doudnae TaxID=3075536 RepID=A0ABD5EH22_9ACTN|nr:MULTISPECIES: hypothetical protein [unclassified Streptomyces]MDT0433593.1 hypothetical protein [Streptomyces sp. DSM 41981]MYQ67499.1 hypothetical protein [Streptomyces sp. SID4950]SCE35861.1 hypothetical protein GA0115242_132817 [Streptomyces sp. SolWspMP-5a-2]